jgi:general secretion pathway protein C
MVFYLSWAANAVLFVAACFLAADTANAIFTSLLTTDEASVEAPAVAQPRPPRRASWADRQVIVDRNLFGASTADDHAGNVQIAEDLEETKLPLVLLGTTAADDPLFSWAAVFDQEARETFVVTIGDLLKDKAEVLRIERRRIVLEEDGEARELTFGDEEEAQPAVARRGRAASARRARTARRSSPNDAVRKLAENRFALPREEVERALDDPTDILSQARFLPKYEGSDMVGFQISGIKQDSVLREFGLQDGDLITSFNGIEIDSPAATARLLQEFNDSSQIDLEYEDANGEPQIATITLD